MPKSEQAKIVSWFYRRQFRDGHLAFDELLRDAVHEVLGKKAIDLDAYIDANRNRLWNALMNQISIGTKRGILPLFIVVDRVSRKIIWYPFCKDIEDKKQKSVLRLCKSRPAFLKRFDNLSHREYEALGCVIAELAGAKDRFLTTPGNDGGVDFFARIVLAGRTHIFSGEYSPIRVVGQSKKYSERVDVDRFGTFLNTLNEVRNLAPNVKHIIPSWFIESSGPIVGWIVAHNGFQSGAETKARNNGVILSDSLDLAEIAAKSRLLSQVDEIMERVDKLHESIMRLLNEYGE